MFARFFSKPLEITIEGKNLRFETIVDFDFALSSRTEVPTSKITELVHLSTEQLTSKATSVRQVEREFLDILSCSLKQPGSISTLLRSLDLKLFTQDHDWRDMMKALIRQPKRFDDHKQLALVKYTQYLASRQDVLKEVYAHKQKEQGPRNATETESGELPFRDTLIFQIPEAPVQELDPSRLTRLGRGENIHLPLVEQQIIPVVLSRHNFKLANRQGAVFIDERANEFKLRQGRNVVGRHPESDVTVDSVYRDISRTHLMIQVHQDDSVTLTDLSSHGSFIPVEAFNTRISE